MISKIIGWLEQNFDSLTEDSIFKFYFSDVDLEVIMKNLYLTNSEEGIGLVLNNEKKILSIHLYSKGYNGHKEYRGEFAFNIDFQASKYFVHQRLGEPAKSGGGEVINFIFKGPISKWDKYYFENYSLHFQYTDNESTINLITIEPVDEVLPPPLM